MVSLEEAKAANNQANLAGKRALLVGGSSGCGKGLALVLSRLGCKITIVGRNEERGAAAAAEITAASPSNETCEFIVCDVRLFANIKEACAKITASHESLDILSLSCTRGGIQGYRPTSEGHDERLMSMYLGRWAWVHALKPLLLKSADPRVLSILSSGKHKPHAAWQSDFLTVKCGPAGRTSAAGWYNDCACSALARQHPSLTTVHIYPGFVRTNWYLELPPGLRGLTKMLMRTGKPLEECGEFMAVGMVQPAYASGCYLRTEFAEAEKPTRLFDDATCDAVWAKTLELYERHL